MTGSTIALITIGGLAGTVLMGRIRTPAPAAVAGLAATVSVVIPARDEERTLAKLLQHLEVPSDGVALDIGCGTGYSTALLARLAHVVVTVEANSALAARARQTLAAQGVTNATVVDGPHEAGAVASGPYDVILINGLVADVPRALLDQMKDAGRLAAIVREGGVGRAMLWRRFGMQFDRRVLFDADAAVLPGFERRAEFVF